jgi:hypothetical protein
MIQLRTFRLPDEESEANSFLKAHRPEGQIMFIGDYIHVLYEDGVYTPEHEIYDLNQMILTAKKMRYQQEVMYGELKAEHADLQPVAKKKEELARLEEVRQAIENCEKNFITFERKISHTQARVDQIKKDNPEIFASN